MMADNLREDAVEYMRRGVPVPEEDGTKMPGAEMPGVGAMQTGDIMQPAQPVTAGGIYSGVDIMGVYDDAVAKYQQNAAVGGAVTKVTIALAAKKLQDFRSYKANLEARIIDNEEWYRLQHWSKERYERDKQRYKRNTGWLFNAIDNKHADFMDNFPDCTVLPREESDEQAAKDLTAIIPVVLKRNGFKQTYSRIVTDKLKNGTGVYFVYWDNAKENGMGDIAIERAEPLNLFWESGIENIQDSSDVFYVELVDNEVIAADYEVVIPDIRSHLTAGTNMAMARYIYNDNIDTTQKSYIVNWYYKQRRQGKTVVHYCRFVNDVVLYASENDSNFAERGWFDHGLYPFVFDNLYTDVGTPFGFGEIDANKETQEDIDEMNSLILRNSKQALRRRYFVRKGAGINESEYADYSKDFIHSDGMLDEANVREIDVNPISQVFIEVLNNKIQELKEISNNRDITAGQTGNSVTAASAIAALQETGSKTSRAMIAKSYDAFGEVVKMVIELIRQFYTVPRSFRILGDSGKTEYRQFDNSDLVGAPEETAFGVSFKGKDPVFDLDIKTFKQNPWSRAAQNQDVINFYQMGFFAPENDVQSLAAMELLDFEGKDKAKDIIEKNGQMAAFIQQILPACLGALAEKDPAAAQAIAQQFGLAPTMAPAPAVAREQGGKTKSMGETDNIGDIESQTHPFVKSAQDRAAASTEARS